MLSRCPDAAPAAHRGPVQRRDRRTTFADGPRAGGRGGRDLPGRHLETADQTGRFRGDRRRGAGVAGPRETRNGHVHGDGGRHARTCGGGARRRGRSALDRRPHLGQPFRHAGDRRCAARVRRARAGEEPGQPRPRTLDRRAGAHLQRGNPPPRGHPPRVHVDRQEPLPQPSDVGDPHRAAAPHPGASPVLRSEPHRRQARAGRAAGAAGDGPGFRRSDGRGALRARQRLERQGAAGDARCVRLYRT